MIKKYYESALSKYLIKPENINFIYEMFNYVSARLFRNYIKEILFERFNKENLKINNDQFPEHIDKNYKFYDRYLLTDTDFTFLKHHKVKKIKSLKKIISF